MSTAPTDALFYDEWHPEAGIQMVAGVGLYVPDRDVIHRVWGPGRTLPVLYGSFLVAPHVVTAVAAGAPFTPSEPGIWLPETPESSIDRMEPEPAASCTTCTPGPARDAVACADPCVSSVCGIDAYCCDVEWDALCASHTSTFDTCAC